MLLTLMRPSLRLRVRTFRWLVPAVAAGLCLGCGSETSTEDAPIQPSGGICDAAVDRLEACGVPVLEPFDCDPTVEQQACQADCLANASCDDLTAATDRAPSTEASEDFWRCVYSCAGQYECADGQDQIPVVWVCNGEVDCADGSDEEDCEPSDAWFECNDDSDAIPSDWVCDGTPDCLDGSDEADC